ncbi:MAG: RimK family alpha-L-glutamate ligase [Bacilli bacterium]|nr:RimK family alpha-L-glutamate ligase [Bacilli bacterium]
MAKLKGICIYNSFTFLPGARHFYDRMREEFCALNVELELKSNADLLAISTKNGLYDHKLDCDFILYLDKDKFSASYLEETGYRLFNSAQAIRNCDDKMLTYTLLAKNGIAIPKTVSGPLNYSGEASDIVIKNIEKELDYPIVAKENFGSLGARVYLLKSHAELASFEEKHCWVARLYQEFISSSSGIDYRIIVIDGKFVAGMKRTNESDFRSNIAKGGHGEKVEIPSAYIELAEKAAKIMGCDYCGVDVLIGPKQEPIICEVNSNAFLTGIEKTTGINIAKIYAEHIVKSLKN